MGSFAKTTCSKSSSDHTTCFKSAGERAVLHCIVLLDCKYTCWTLLLLKHLRCLHGLVCLRASVLSLTTYLLVHCIGRSTEDANMRWGG